MKLKILKGKYYEGFTSFILAVVKQIYNLKKNEILHVELENICYSNTKKTWDKYLDQPFKKFDKIIKKKLEEKNFKIIKYNNGKPLPFDYLNENKKTLSNRKIINKIRGIFKKYINFKNEIIEDTTNFISKTIYKKNVLSIHIRSTDNLMTGHATGQKHLMSYEDYIKPLVKKKLIEKKCKKIFLATDNFTIYQKFKKDFKNNLIKLDTIIIKKNTHQSLHKSNIYASEEIKTKLVTDVIRDIIIMSKCKYSLLSSSGVSLLSILMRNNYNYEFIDNHINYKKMSF